jgi:hypothetical protein
MIWHSSWERKQRAIRRSNNKPNCGVLHGHRYMVYGTVNQIKKIVGNHAKKVQTSGYDGVVEIIHSDNRGCIFHLLRDAKIKFAYSFR